MARKIQGSIPPGVDITDGWIVRFTAVDPVTGDVNTDVQIASAALLVDNLGGGNLSGGFTLGDIEWLHIPEGPPAAKGGG